MKTSSKLFALGMILMGFGLNANAQISDTESATANARIVSPIALTNVTSLEFGNIIADADGGTVRMPASSTPTRVATGITLPDITGTIRAASFTVSGENLLNYSVTLPADNVVSLISGSNSMKLTEFTHSASGTIGETAETFYVGATLNLGVSQPTGTYSGTFNVTVNYN